MLDALVSEDLIKLAREKSSESRRRLAAIISDLFAGNVRTLTDRERDLMFDIMRRMVREVEMQVRKMIAEKLADVPEAPRDLAVQLAKDEIEVAFPMLSRSPVLRDEDLIEIIRNRTQEHQMAIAIRHAVSEKVSDALVRDGKETVVRALLENKSAKLSKATLEYLVEQSRRVDTFQEPILRRGDLGPDLAKRMFVWVSAALRQFIVDHYPLKPSVIDDLLEKTLGDLIDDLATNRQRPRKSEELAGELMRTKKATPELLIAVLEDGEINLFVSLIRKMAGLRENLVMRMILEPGGEGLAILCRALGFGKAIFATIFTLIHQAQRIDHKRFRRDLRKILSFYDRIEPTSAKEVVDLWRRDVEYLMAIRELELGAAPDA